MEPTRRQLYLVTFEGYDNIYWPDISIELSKLSNEELMQLSHNITEIIVARMSKL